MEHDEMIAVIQAHKEGKPIECRDIELGGGFSEWRAIKTPDWNFELCEYRVKPEPHYRPFKSAEEVMEAIKEHGDWMKRQSCFYRISQINVTPYGDVAFFFGAMQVGKTEEMALSEFTWADGTPFGVKED